VERGRERKGKGSRGATTGNWVADLEKIERCLGRGYINSQWCYLGGNRAGRRDSTNIRRFRSDELGHCARDCVEEIKKNGLNETSKKYSE
jgi:hypothetical protein